MVKPIQMTIQHQLFHVRGSAPSPGARTLRFRNTFRQLSCLLAISDKTRSVQDWYSRFLTSTYGTVSKVTWTDTEIQVYITREEHWQRILNELQSVRAYMYVFILDERWNKHPDKDCYFTRSNVRYTPSEVVCVDFTTATKGKHLKIIAMEQLGET